LISTGGGSVPDVSAHISRVQGRHTAAAEPSPNLTSGNLLIGRAYRIRWESELGHPLAAAARRGVVKHEVAEQTAHRLGYAILEPCYYFNMPN